MATFNYKVLEPAAAANAVHSFEIELASWFGVRFASFVSSGTAAIHCALAALGVTKNDDVLVPALAVTMSVAPILYLGATPVFVDIGESRVDFDYDDLARRVSAKTKAILPVYLWGCSYDMPKLLDFAEAHGLKVVEDACQAHGSQFDGRYLGTFGHAGCFSTHGSKLLSTGEGGFVLTNDEQVNEFVKLYRNHWQSGTEASSFLRLGHNYRATGIQASIGRNQLRRLRAQLSVQKARARYVMQRFVASDKVDAYRFQPKEVPNSSNILFLHRQSGRAASVRLAERGVVNSVGTYGLVPVHMRTFIEAELGRNFQAPLTPNTVALLNRILAIPITQYDDEHKLDQLVETLNSCL